MDGEGDKVAFRAEGGTEKGKRMKGKLVAYGQGPEKGHFSANGLTLRN